MILNRPRFHALQAIRQRASFLVGFGSGLLITKVTEPARVTALRHGTERLSAHQRCDHFHTPLVDIITSKEKVRTYTDSHSARRGP